MEMIMIKDAAKNLGVESHVLRYWEEELGIEIKRNSMGHRYYDERDIKMFHEVKELRDRGFSLKDIKEGIERQRNQLKPVKQVVVEEIKGEGFNGLEDKLAKVAEKRDADCEAKSEQRLGTGCKDKSEQRLGTGCEEKTEQKVLRQDMPDVKLEGTSEDTEESNELKIVDFKTAQLQTMMNKIVANALKENKDIITSSIKSELTTDVMRQFDTVMREKEEKEEERYRKLDETIRNLQRSNEEVAATRVKKGLFGRNKKK